MVNLNRNISSFYEKLILINCHKLQHEQYYLSLKLLYKQDTFDQHFMAIISIQSNRQIMIYSDSHFQINFISNNNYIQYFMIANKNKKHSLSLISNKQQVKPSKKTTTKGSKHKNSKSRCMQNITDWNQLITEFGNIRKTIQNLSVSYSPRKSKLRPASAFQEHLQHNQSINQKYQPFVSAFYIPSELKTDQNSFSPLKTSCSLRKEKLNCRKNYQKQLQQIQLSKMILEKDLNALQKSHLRLARENKILQHQLYFKNLEKDKLLSEMRTNSSRKDRNYSYDSNKSNPSKLHIAIQTQTQSISPIRFSKNLEKTHKKQFKLTKTFLEDFNIKKIQNRQYDRLVTKSFIQDFQMFFQRKQSNLPKRIDTSFSSKQSMLLDDFTNQYHTPLHSLSRQHQNILNMQTNYKKNKLTKLEEQFDQLVCQSRKQNSKTRRLQLRKQMASIARDIKQLKNS